MGFYAIDRPKSFLNASILHINLTGIQMIHFQFQISQRTKCPHPEMRTDKANKKRKKFPSVS